MATEKILNTKVLLRYDTLANWQKTDITNGGANYVPKKGEACVYEIPTGASNVEGVRKPPAIMIRVGDGTNKVSDLPWTAATAADVYAWAKKSQLPVKIVDNGTGKFVTDVTGAWDEAKNEYTLTLTRDNVGMTITEVNGTNDGKYVTGLVWDKATETLKPQMVAFDTIIDASTKDSTNAPQTKAVKTYVDQEVAKAVSGGVEGLATKTYVDDQDTATLEAAKKYTDDNEKTSSVSSGSTVITVAPTTTGNNTDYKVSIDLSGYQAKGDYKTIQDEVTSPAANGNATAFIDSISQDTNGVITATKKSIDLSGYKTKQTAVTDKITDKAHVLDSLTQDANGNISYTVKKLTPSDIGAKSTQNTYTKTLTGAQVVGTVSQNENGEITVTDRTLTAADLGLDSAMHFIGVSTTAPTKGPGNRELQNGDVYLNSANNTEYVWADGKWNELGDEGTAGSHALKTTAIPGGELIESTAKLDGSGAINHGIPSGAKAGTSTASNGALTHGGKLKLPTITTDKFGHVTGTGTEEVTLPTVPSIDFDTDTRYAVSTETSIELPVISGLTANGHTLNRTISKITSNGDITVDGSQVSLGDVVLNIADKAVTTAKINDKAVTKAKLADEVLGNLGPKTVKEYVDGAIADLDVIDTAKTNQYVSAVSETDGKISVSRATLPVYSVDFRPNEATYGAKAVSLYVNGTKNTSCPNVPTVEGMTEAISNSIATLDYLVGDSGDAPCALTGFKVENGKLTSYTSNDKLTGYIEDLDQRESTVLVLFGGSATENI